MGIDDKNDLSNCDQAMLVIRDWLFLEEVRVASKDYIQNVIFSGVFPGWLCDGLAKEGFLWHYSNISNLSCIQMVIDNLNLLVSGCGKNT